MNGASAMRWLISQRNKKYKRDYEVITQEQVIKNEFPQPISIDTTQIYYCDTTNSCSYINDIFTNQPF
jgi:hypothetical protein